MKNRTLFITFLLVSVFSVSIISTAIADGAEGEIQCILCAGWDVPGQHDCPELNDDDDDGIWDNVITIVDKVTLGIPGLLKAGANIIFAYEDEMIDWYISPYTEATDDTPNCSYCKKGCSSCGSSSDSSSSSNSHYWACGQCSYSVSSIDYDEYTRLENNACPACGR